MSRYQDYTNYVDPFLKGNIDTLSFNNFIIELMRVKVYILKKKRPVSPEDKVSVNINWLMSIGDLRKATRKGEDIILHFDFARIRLPYNWLKDPDKAIKEYTDWAEKYIKER